MPIRETSRQFAASGGADQMFDLSDRRRGENFFLLRALAND